MRRPWICRLFILVLAVMVVNFGLAEPVSITKEVAGFGGAVSVTVIFKDGVITDVQIEGPNETDGWGGDLIKELPALIVASGSAEVDVTTSATTTLKAVLGAVQNAIDEQAGTAKTVERSDYTGTLNGSASGYGGPVPVTIEFENGNITKVEIGENKETYSIGTHAIDWLPEKIVEQQNIAVDSVSGATVTSGAIKSAIETAMQEAGIDTTAYKLVNKYEKESEEAISLKTDLLVIGGGISGLSAALKGKNLGADVILLERLDFVGGESAMTGGEMLAEGSQFQKSLGIEDSPQALIEDIKIVGHGKQLDRLTKLFAEELGARFDEMQALVGWRTENIMADTTEGTSGIQRAWMVDGKRGSYIPQPMADKLEELGATIMLHTEGYELIVDETGTVAGAKARDTKSGQEFVIDAGAVVLATGGFSQDKELLEQFGITGLFSAPLQISTGMGQRMALSLNAGTYMMDMVCNRPGGMIGNNGLAYNCNNGLAAIRNDDTISYVAVNAEGERYAPELTDYETDLEYQQNMLVPDINAVSTNNVVAIGGTAYCILDQAGFDLWRSKSASIPDSLIADWLETNGSGLARLTCGNTVGEAAAAMGLDPEKVEASVAKFNQYAADGVDPDFGCAQMNALSAEGPYYIIGNQNRYNSHMGGLLASNQMEILREDETAIKGLYGAGSIIGGHQGDIYIGGGMMGWGMTSGSIAAENAIAYLQK